jgi:aldehyde dehydrogenase (NAD+)
LIVAADADVDAAADAAAWGGFSNGGQTCVGVERIYVEQEVAAEFIAALTERLKPVRAGSSRGSGYGPMTVGAQVETVRRHVRDAIASGARTPLGGEENIRGRFVDPILLVDGAETTTAVREETFGPTVTVRSVRDVNEAISLANASEFGLGAAVFSRSHADNIAARLRCGMVSINSVIAFVSIPALPFGGVGSSGYGRLHGAAGLKEFSVTKSIARKKYPLPGMNAMLMRRPRVTLPALRLTTTLRFGGRRRLSR